MSSVTIDYELCIGAKKCGGCYYNCSMLVFDIDGDIVVIAHEENCIGCSVCEDICPTGAIKVIR